MYRRGSGTTNLVEVGAGLAEVQKQDWTETIWWGGGALGCVAHFVVDLSGNEVYPCCVEQSQSDAVGVVGADRGLASR